MRFTLFIVALLPLSLTAQTPNPACDELSHAVTQSEKEMSRVLVSGLADNSAPRATLREQEVANELQLIQLNMILSIQLKCPSRKEPISRNAYLSPALECEAARQKQAIGDTSTPPECDLDKWKRLGEK